MVIISISTLLTPLRYLKREMVSITYCMLLLIPILSVPEALRTTILKGGKLDLFVVSKAKILRKHTKTHIAYKKGKHISI